jgi:hypothetical protein
MAITTLRKLLEHFGWMRFTVARLTRWYVFVFLLVAISTGKIVVFGRIRLEKGHGFAMTPPAVVRWNLIRVSDHKGHVNRVARLTGFKIHVCGVLFVALHAIRDLPVHGVTLVASQIRVGTRLGFHFVPLLWMACETGTGNVTF